MAKRIWLSWSSGKDSAWALHVLRQRGDVRVVGLLTTLNQPRDRVAMHAVRGQLLRMQAELAGVPLIEVELPEPCTNADYERAMAGALERARAAGVRAVAFGDLFLRDIRQYRETQMQGTGLEPLFPLWELPTDTLARDMLRAGVRARITCVDTRRVSVGLAGAEWDARALERLPADADPCGENGEFHTFVTAGPMLSGRLDVTPGEVVERDGFAYADIVPAASSAGA